MSKNIEYRIRWAWIDVYVGKDSYIPQKRCIAEYAKKIFGKTIVWLPVYNAKWQPNEFLAEKDIQLDREIHEIPLPETKYFDGDA